MSALAVELVLLGVGFEGSFVINGEAGGRGWRCWLGEALAAVSASAAKLAVGLVVVIIIVVGGGFGFGANCGVVVVVVAGLLAAEGGGVSSGMSKQTQQECSGPK